jgi:preprotein translocase subunit SecA
MVKHIINKIIGNRNSREVRRIFPTVEKINAIEESYRSLQDEELAEMTRGWKERVRLAAERGGLAGERRELDLLLPEAFAAVKNAARRLCGRVIHVQGRAMEWQMIHFDVQLVGGVILHQGKIAEMATGEGKTLVATLPLYLNALAGKGVHLVTANDYLAQRDSEWVGQIFRFLGLTVGAIQSGQDPSERRKQYLCDITYGTSSEFGFDYLRDNGMAQVREQMVQRGHYFAVVDEVDSLLIDEARTPLIISGHAQEGGHLYDTLRGPVDALVRAQSIMCSRLAEEARECVARGDAEGAGRDLLKLKMGAPRSKGFLRTMEDPEMRKLLDKAELSFHHEGGKAALVELKEELLFTIDERGNEADLTERGRQYLNPDDPDGFVLPDIASEIAELEAEPIEEGEKTARRENIHRLFEARAVKIHNISQLLRAHCLHEKDVDYVVEGGKVIIVDQFTGRKMPGRRWSDGLHQAVEAKEGVVIDRETRTMATITIQNYFRLYEKLAGMTGTAATEANEFHDIYGLDVLSVPTHRPVARNDDNDLVYKTRREKYNAVVREIKRRHETGQPVLVGTVSVEASEVLSRMLRREGVIHSVLNAKFHQQEAEIVARAGQRGAVTISTNMAGRGTDIRLGSGVVELGGLHVIGTERHESRRIDRQLRGRCARQGDPGSSQFFVSFEDDLMRNFGGAGRMTKIMEKFGMQEDEELQHPWLSKSVEGAQKRVEQRNYVARKRTLEFDDVMNQQREVIYGYRNEAVETGDPGALVLEAVTGSIRRRVMEIFERTGKPDEGKGLAELIDWVSKTHPVKLSEEELKGLPAEECEQVVAERVEAGLRGLSSGVEARQVAESRRWVVLSSVDRLWQDHLHAMDGLREAVHLRSIGQKDPLVEYKREAYSLFSGLMERIQDEISISAWRVAWAVLGDAQRSGNSPDTKDEARRPPDIIDLLLVRKAPRPGRNTVCPCGTGKKYKHCCGRVAA